jgi:hypothetical protein
MKRSEMELYLEQQLIELRGYQEDNAEIVDVLLYAVEEAGMLPPPHSVCIFTRKPKPRGEAIMYKWEPEDE